MIEATHLPSPSAMDRYRTKGWWGEHTFGDILEARVGEHPDRVAFIDAGRRVTYAELWSQVRRFAEFLRRQGLGRGDVVTLQMPNRIEFPVVFFALELVGAVGNKISSDLRAVEVDYILRFSKSKAYVCPHMFKGFDYVEMIGAIRDRLPNLRTLICVDAVDQPVITSFADAIADTPEIGDADRVRMTADEIMRMCFTSGTTGNPKGVLHSFNTTLCAARFFNDYLAMSADDVFLIYLPVGLNWGYLSLLQTVMAGACAVLMERFSAKGAIDAIARERVTYIPTAPASIVAMLNAETFATTDLSSLRLVVTGGASASVETIRALQAALPDAKLIELYGMLETGFHSITRLTDDPLKVNGTIGRCIDELELTILDDDGRGLPHGTQGEIAAKGPSIHLGYLDNEQANRDSFNAEGWFLSGDLGEVVDDDGNVRISGRKKEIINRAGKKYFPREIEEILYEHPAFLQVAIVGMPDARLGERNCLCAVLKPGRSVTLDEAVAFLKGRVADYKLPEQLVVRDEIPMTPSGKIRRGELVKELVADRT